MGSGLVFCLFSLKGKRQGLTPMANPPHKLRHTFLKKVTDKYGVHFAQELSGNVSIKEIFRYAKPSQDEMQETIDLLFD